MAQPVLKIDRFSYTYPGTGDTVLKRIHLEINAGECVCISGPTGSGKSTLLLAIKNLLPDGRQTGNILTEIPEKTTGMGIGLVLQNPETQLLGNTVGSETAFGLENLCVLPDKMNSMVHEALSAVGLDFPLDFPVMKLSMGQKYRLILASVLVMAPAIVLLDEPGAQLDPDGISKLNTIITALKTRGVGFIICEHHPRYFKDVIDSNRQLDSDGLLKQGRNLVKAGTSADQPFLGSRTSPGDTNVLVVAEKLCVTGDDAKPIWSKVDFTIHSGQRIGIYGDNGSGKTTLLRCLTGFISPSDGKVLVYGKSPSPKYLRGETGCLYQNPHAFGRVNGIFRFAGQRFLLQQNK